MNLYGGVFKGSTSYSSAGALAKARAKGAAKGTGRTAAGTARGAFRVGGAVVGGAALMAGVNPLAMMARMNTGLGGVFAAGMAGKKLFMSGFKKGKGGGKDKDEVINETSIVGPTGKLLAKVHKEVVAIKGLLIDTDPASAAREAAFEEEHRHRRLIAALSGLGGMGGAGPKTEKKSFWDWLKGLLPLLLGALGLAMLPKLIENLPSIFEAIQNVFDKLAALFEDMQAFFATLGMTTRRVLKKYSTGTKTSTAKTTKTSKNRASRFRRFAGRVAGVIPRMGFGSPTVHEKTSRTRPTKPATSIVRHRPGLASEKAGQIEEKSRQQRDAKRFKDARIKAEQNQFKKAQDAAAESRRQAALDKEQRARDARKLAEQQKQRIAREQFRAGEKPSQQKINQSYRGDPKVQANLLENRINDKLKGIQNKFKILTKNVVMARNLTRYKFRVAQRGIERLSQRIGNFTRLARPSSAAARRITGMFNQGGVNMSGTKGAPKSTPPSLRGRVAGRMFTGTGFGGLPGAEQGRVGGSTSKAVVPASVGTNTGPSMKGGWEKMKRIGTQWIKIGSIGRQSVERAIGSKALKVGGRIVAPIALAWLALDLFEAYYNNVYLPEMKKITSTIVNKKGRVVDKFDANDPRVIKARKGLFNEMRRIIPVLAIAAGSGFVGMAVGAWIGGLIGGFISAVTIGLGAAAVPILALVGGLAGGIWGFQAGLNIADSEIGQQLTTAMAPEIDYNDTAVRWAENIYSVIVTMENNALREWKVKMRLARGIPVEGVVPSQLTIRRTVASGKALTPDFRNENTKKAMKLWGFDDAQVAIAMGVEPTPSELTGTKGTGGVSMSGINYGAALGIAGSRGETNTNEATLKKAISNHAFYANMDWANFSEGNKRYYGNKMAKAGAEVYKLLYGGNRFSKKVTIILQNTAFNNVNVPHIVDNTSMAVSNMTVGPTVMAGVR